MNIQIHNENNVANEFQKEQIINFLFHHLEEYGDPKNDIKKSLDYAMGENQKAGGTVLYSTNPENQEISGAVILNKTGMKGYIPENILVYIATDKNLRGKGIGKALMQKAIEVTNGDIALHCEPENPARKLYEKLGFTSKYLEMRLKK